MANPVTVIGARPSQGRVRALARSGTTWKGFAAGQQPKRQRAQSNKSPWSYATTTWRTLSSSQKAAWAAIAPAGMSGYALFVQAATRQAKGGDYAPPAAPATFPSYPPVTNAHFVALDYQLYAEWDWTGTGNAHLNVQISPPRGPTQLYTTPKTFQTLFQANAPDSPVALLDYFYGAWGFYPQPCYVIVQWQIFDGDSGITVNQIRTQEYLPDLLP